MTIAAALLPLFAQVGLTMALLLWLGRLRVPAVRAGAVHMRDIALGEQHWPKRALQASNAFSNQFELPVLFYVAVLIAIVADAVSATFVVLSWLFVVSRMGHALIHITTNNVPRRSFVFAVGFVFLAALWLTLFVSVFLA